MRKTIFIVLLAAASNGALAVLGERENNGQATEWIEVGQSDLCILYSSPMTIRRERELVRIWELLDHKAIIRFTDGTEHLSIKRHSEYDCKQDRWRTLNLTLHSGNMATGEVVYSSADADDWRPVSIGSPGDAFRSFACSRR